MPRNLTHRPLLVEQLENRLYLSASGKHHAVVDAAALHELLPVAQRLIAKDQNLTAELQTLRSNNQVAVVIIDLGTDGSDAVLATLNPLTGVIEPAVPIANGRVLVVGDMAPITGNRLPNGSFDFSDLAPQGSFTNGQKTPDTGSTVSDPTHGMGGLPVFVVFPPDREDPDSRPPRPNRPAVVLVSTWLGGLNGSAWWAHAVDSVGVRSRLDTVRAGVLEDENANETGEPFVGDLAGDRVSSRVVLRSPIRLLVFSEPVGTDGAGELAVYNFATGQLSRTGQSVVSPLLIADGNVAFLGLDAEERGANAAMQPTLRLYNPTSGGIRNTGVKAEALRVDGRQLIVGMKATGQAANYARNNLIAHRYDPASGRLTNFNTAYPVTETGKASRVERTADEIERTAGIRLVSSPFLPPTRGDAVTPGRGANSEPTGAVQSGSASGRSDGKNTESSEAATSDGSSGAAGD